MKTTDSCRSGGIAQNRRPSLEQFKGVLVKHWHVLTHDERIQHFCQEPSKRSQLAQGFPPPLPEDSWEMTPAPTTLSAG